MNPFSNGSASYLTNMVTNLMPDAGGDNAMWKERAVALLGALMPRADWKRDHAGFFWMLASCANISRFPRSLNCHVMPICPNASFARCRAI